MREDSFFFFFFFFFQPSLDKVNGPRNTTLAILNSRAPQLDFLRQSCTKGKSSGLRFAQTQ